MNIALLLEMVAEGDPDRIVVGRSDDGVRAAELLDRARRVAGYLVESGAKHVGFAGLNSDVLPLALFGAALAGLPFVPLNYRSTDDQLARALDRISPSVVITDDEAWPRVVGCGAHDMVKLSDLVAVSMREIDNNPLPMVSADEIAILLFTSGTTGEPKAAILRHRHLVSYIFGSVEFLGCDSSEAQLVSVPPYHIAGMSTVLSSLYSGRRLVYLPAFDPESWVRTAIDQSVTHAMVVPTMLSRILEHLETNDVGIPTLRHLSYGGGRMPAELIERALRALPHVDFVNAYGLTETSSTVAMLTPADHREAFASTDPNVRVRLASVGRPLPALDVEIRDADGHPVAPGSQGEIWVRGDQVAGEYVGQAGDSSDGWFRTKDAGYFDQEGYLFVEGRLDDVIVRGGENISPGEVEDIIARHPAVSDVAVVGVPDPEWGEAVAAVVVVHLDQMCTETDVQEWVRQHLRSNKVPSLVLFSDELPYNSTGKLLRRVLRDQIGTAGQSG